MPTLPDSWVESSFRPRVKRTTSGSNATPSSHSHSMTGPRDAAHIGSVLDEWPMYSSQAGDYILGKPIGMGASSIVFAATFKPLNNKPCAIKVIDLEAFGRDTEELRRETQLMSLSKHPNVLRVRGCWVQGTKLHIATRLMSSGSLLDIMRYSHKDGFPEEVICTALKQALQGLNYLHVNGWLHRDLKSGNLLVDEDGTVLLGDFGVGVWVGEGKEGSKRKSFVGTPCWMAPEVIERKHYNAKADIWSFGITALELSQGHAPYSRLAPVNVLKKTLQEDAPKLDTTNGAHKYSKSFADFVKVCLQKDPAKRPTAEKLLKHSFFKNAKSPKSLVSTILSDLPPLTARQERVPTGSMRSLRSQYSWDFSSADISVGSPSDSSGSLLKDPFYEFTASVSDPAPSPLSIRFANNPFASTQKHSRDSSASRGAILSIDGEHVIALKDDQDGPSSDEGESPGPGTDMSRTTSSDSQQQGHNADQSSAASEVDAGASEGITEALPKLNIAMVSDFFYPNVGGVEGHILAISKSLSERGHRVVIITHAYKPSRFGVRHLYPGFTVYYLPVRVLANQDTLPNFFTSHPLMRQIFIREGIQLVHGHQALSSLAHEAIFHARTLGIKTVFTDHSLFSLDEDAASVLTNKLLRFVLSDVDRVVCVSYTGKENTVLRAAIKDPDRIVSVIPNAVDSTKFYPPDPPLIPPDRITIVVLSRLMYRKGIDLLLEAIPRICRLHPRVDFLIGGDGPKRVDLEQMRERHLFLMDRVSLVGAVRQGSVRDHLIQGQIFLSPSLTEAFGTSLIEAASCGLLVVATSVGGVPEVLPEEMMYLAEPSSTSLVQKMSEAIRRLEDQSSSASHDPWTSHAAMAKMYNWDSISQRLEGVYHSAMEEETPTMMTRLEKYWDNSGGWAAGIVFCIVIMVDMWFGMMLEVFWPADSIQKRISKKEDDLAFEEETDDAVRSR